MPNTDEEHRTDAVFAGGGVRAIAYVGAIEVLETRGYAFRRCVGTSAGAMIAALVTAGYKASELRTILMRFDFASLRDSAPEDIVPAFGPLLSLLKDNGIYRGARLQEWLGGLLEARGVRTFADLRDDTGEYRLRVITADISRGRIVVLPDDLHRYGYDPDAFSPALAVRMSAALPFFFEPVALKPRKAPFAEAVFVDGGVALNFPFDLCRSAGLPVLGFRVAGPDTERPRNVRGPIAYASALMETLLGARDRMTAESPQVITITVPNRKATDFDLSAGQKKRLMACGRTAVVDWLAARAKD